MGLELDSLIHYWQVKVDDTFTFNLYSGTNQSMVCETIKQLEELKKLKEATNGK